MSHYKPYPAYKYSGVEWLGRVPEHWVVKKLKWLASLQSGDFITSESIEEEGTYPVFGGNGLRGYTNAFTHDGSFALVGRQGALCGNINYAHGQFWASEHAVVVSPYESVATTWLGELLRTMNLNQYSVSAAQPGLAVERVIDLYVPVPPPSEQQIIAANLDREIARIDGLVAKKTHFIELLREKRQALITHAVTNGLNSTNSPGTNSNAEGDPQAKGQDGPSNVKMKDSGVQWLGEVPEHWEVKKLKWLASLQSGDFITSETIGSEGEYPVFGGNGLRGYTDRFTHEGSYVLIGRQGALCGNVNYSYGRFWASEHAVVVSPYRPVVTTWLGELLRIMNLNQYSVASAQPGLAVERIVDLSIPIPSLEEQGQIAQYILRETGHINSVLSKTEISIVLLKERRSTLITAAVTGQIDLREAV